jgi:hypothetical protein
VNRFSLIIFIFLLLPGYAAAEVLTTDTVWSNVVEITEDIVIPAGVTLTIRPGTSIRVQPAESTKIDPEYMSHRNEITVRGTLLVQGNAASPVTFIMEEHDLLLQWAGIIVDSGRADLQWCTIQGAETGITVMQGKMTGGNLTITGNRYGWIDPL